MHLDKLAALGATVKVTRDEAGRFHARLVQDSRPHDITSRECACGPLLRRLCDECQSKDPACWKCAGELLDASTDLEPIDRWLLVMHFSTALLAEACDHEDDKA